jgi:hypothetical protein
VGKSTGFTGREKPLRREFLPFLNLFFRYRGNPSLSFCHCNKDASALEPVSAPGQSHERFLDAKFAVRFTPTGLNGSGWPLSPR